ncbi:MAG: GIY-YIG nuclease family protein [bacterium]
MEEIKNTDCYVYMIECMDGTYYIGIANDYKKRWEQHKKGTGAKYIKGKGFKKPVFLQKVSSKSEAMRLEIKYKKYSKQKKKTLISSDSNILISALHEKSILNEK